ncbi:integrase core domain-containing protein [Methylobacterium radiodurans]|uniref:integrase core domain-containing protein n=1 Tax=Methylobacterium radiodurans TaxID=2202828 RepID=UPI003CCC7AD9
MNGEIFYTLKEAQIVIESWRRHYNGVRSHAALTRPAPPAKRPVEQRPILHEL